VQDELAGPERAHDRDGFLEHLEPHGRRRPAVGEDVLVQVLAGADPEEEAAVEHQRRRGRSLGHDRRVDANGRAGHARAECQLVRHLRDSADDRPDERAVSLRRGPRVVVVGDQREAKAGLLGEPRVLDHLARTVEL
jgi:hypothetical protein